MVDNINDKIIENANEGIDLVQSSLTYTLGENLENLTLTGTNAINGTGNAMNNKIVGNAANNTLTGHKGNDTLNGGDGNDIYIFNAGDGKDTIVENGNTATSQDTLMINGLDEKQLWFSRGKDTAGSFTDHLIITQMGTANRVTIKDWYKGDQYHVEKIQVGSKALIDTQVDNLVQAMAAYTVPTHASKISISNLTTAQQNVLLPVIAASWG